MTELLVIVNLVLIESLLSLDNVAVLASMVSHLWEVEKKKALQYWILWAYVFRWLCLLFASFLIKIVWLKALWGLYLLYLAYQHFLLKPHEEWISSTNYLHKYLWVFRWTVAWIEFVDLSLSIDNVLAAVALSPNIRLVMIWCFIWILAIRFAAGVFIDAMKKYPELEWIAFGVIWMLWVKLVISFLANYIPALEFIHHHTTDIIVSAWTIIAFLFPVMKSYVTRKN